MECKDFDPQVFAERLRDLRLEKGVGQNKLAADLGLSNASISYWENAKQEPTASAIVKLASYFDVPTDYLLGRVD
ncbi:MAG: helix-turn-helix transcriptional regulator [Clostridia bacterium]|nr:helix-turn-helix transcriptional regulator [Clostridia bacterium]